MFEESFDMALVNYAQINQLRHDQSLEKEEFEKQQDEIQQEKIENGEPYERQSKNWEEFQYAPFKTRKSQFVVCLNTLGQDRQYTQDEIQFALKAVKNYRDTWEALEKRNLEHDVNLALKYRDWDNTYKEHYIVQDDARLDEAVDEMINQRESQQVADGEDPLTEEEKDKITKKTRYDSITATFYAPELAALHKAKLAKEAADKANDNRASSALSSVKSEKKSLAGSAEGEKVPDYVPLEPEMWLARCREFSEFHIMKFHRVFQSIIYLTKFRERAEVCEWDTNKLSWKRTRELLCSTDPENPDLYAKLGGYVPFGSKDDEY